MPEEIITHSAEETIAWGRELAKRLQPPVLVLLSGEFGQRQNYADQGRLVAGLNAATEDEVTSPTFTLIHEYGGGQRVFHGDLYRIENFHDFETLGLEDVFCAACCCHPGVVGKFPPENPLAADSPAVAASGRRRAQNNRTLI